MARYNNNFLDTVILEIKYEDISLASLEEFRTTLVEQFPIQKQEKAFEGTINFDADGGLFEQSKVDKVVWSFSAEDKPNKVLRLSQDFISLEYSNKTYTNSDELLGDVKTVIDKFIEVFSVKIINRVGLRYSNRIPAKHNDEKPGITELIAPELIAAYLFTKEMSDVRIARSMAQQTIKYDDCDMGFSFGVWNNDFPNRVVKDDFILDYDCYTNLPISSSEINITDTVKSFNVHIETMFEKCIKDKVRQWMGLTNNA